MLQKEIRIDPGNEHHHRTDADDKIFDEDIDRSPRYDADAGMMEQEPRELNPVKDDEPGTGGENF